MSQNAEREAAIKKIRKLKEIDLSRGNSESEALMAMEKAAQLMEVFSITMDEVSLRSEPCIKIVIDSGSSKTSFMNGVVVGISKFTGAVGYRTKGYQKWMPDGKGGLYRGRTNHTYTFFGHESDVLMAEHLYKVIKAAVEYEYKKYQASDAYKAFSRHRLEARKGFMDGVAIRISDRLFKMADEKNDNMDSLGNGGLIVMKEYYIRQQLEGKGVSLTKSKPGRISFNSAYLHGSDAGDSIGLNRPIENNSRTLAIGGY